MFDNKNPIGEPEDILNEVDPIAAQKALTPSVKVGPQPAQKPLSPIIPGSGIPSVPGAVRKSSPPPNLPGASIVQEQKSVNIGTKDIFSEIDPNPEKPGMPVGLQIKDTRQDEALIAPDVERKKPLLKSKIFVIILLVVIFLGILGAAAYFILKELNRSVGTDVNSNMNSVNADLNLANTPSANGISENANVEPSLNAASNEPVATPTPIIVDMDYDGLSDADEKMYGTDPAIVDTDSDGLSDRDEVKVWKTDPLNPDSDGDGYKDGEEVQNKYDPLGSGKLIE